MRSPPPPSIVQPPQLGEQVYSFILYVLHVPFSCFVTVT